MFYRHDVNVGDSKISDELIDLLSDENAHIYTISRKCK